MTAPSPNLPGRLGAPGLLLRDDPRADPRMIAAMLPLGMAGAAAPPPVDASGPRHQLLAFAEGVEAGFEAMLHGPLGRPAGDRGRHPDNRGDQG